MMVYIWHHECFRYEDRNMHLPSDGAFCILTLHSISQHKFEKYWLLMAVYSIFFPLFVKEKIVKVASPSMSKQLDNITYKYRNIDASRSDKENKI